MASSGTPYVQQDVEPMWLDCDPGHDDMIAIILAAYAPGVRLLGISTVHGNVSVEKTTLNTLRILKMAGIEGVEVVMGQAAPLARPPRVCPEIHGESGLEGAKRELPSATLSEATTFTKAVIRMAHVISRTPIPVTIVCTGSHTNIALFLTLYPELKKKIKRIVFMGGAMGLGNTGPVAEFNIQVDPEASKIVMESGVQLVMVPLEVTHTVLVTDDVRTRLIRMQTPFTDTILELLMFFANTYERVFGFPDPPLHDPCAVAFVLQPQLFQTRLMRVDVETASPLAAGQTVCDVYGMSNKPLNVHVAHKCDVAGVWRLIFDAITKASSRSPLNPHIQVKVEQRKLPDFATNVRGASISAVTHIDDIKPKTLPSLSSVPLAPIATRPPPRAAVSDIEADDDATTRPSTSDSSFSSSTTGSVHIIRPMGFGNPPGTAAQV